MKTLKEELSKELFGQEQAINTVVSSMKAGMSEKKNAPRETYLFLGSPATGKTYLAELMSKISTTNKMVVSYMVILLVGKGMVSVS
ncbi:hypothetical protein MNB_SM-4-15 [hydrothermal vent metagenome]|uniref:Uncharacterized protein n=1 Tax=hydrothermal vent metagenome TaxID=652676 RepID=A0A1W1C8R7_9ZZZZ